MDQKINKAFCWLIFVITFITTFAIMVIPISFISVLFLIRPPRISNKTLSGNPNLSSTGNYFEYYFLNAISNYILIIITWFWLKKVLRLALPGKSVDDLLREVKWINKFMTKLAQRKV